MAIVKMKKLRLMAIRSNKDALLKELICKGCVEFSEIEGEVQDSDFKELLKRESSSLMTFKSQHMALVNAVGILDRYSPAKKPLLSALPEVGEDVLLDDGGVGAALAAADEISANEDRIKSIGAEVGRPPRFFMRLLILIISAMPDESMKLRPDMSSTQSRGRYSSSSSSMLRIAPRASWWSSSPAR